ncbi:MAG: hypothetical protein NTY77_12010 [Elusimicrobia bacterium]|nr:hypothetical protein [Elusimicrobiota bacterium]
MMKTQQSLKELTLAAAFIALSPGLPADQAFAAVVGKTTIQAVPANAGMGALGASRIGSGGLSAAPAASLQGASLSGILNINSPVPRLDPKVLAAPAQSPAPIAAQSPAVSQAEPIPAAAPQAGSQAAGLSKTSPQAEESGSGAPVSAMVQLEQMAAAKDSKPVPAFAVRPDDGQLAVAKALAAKLREATNAISAREILDAMRILAAANRDERLQAYVSLELIGNMRRASSIIEYRDTVSALKGIADRAASDLVLKTIIRGAMGEAASVSSILFFREALDAAERSAIRSSSLQTKAMAVRLMRQELGKGGLLFDRDLEAAIGRIRTS